MLRYALALMFTTAETLRAEVEALTRQAVTAHQVEQVLTGIWPDRPDATARTRAGAGRRREALRTMYRTDRVAGWHGTTYGLVQAASTWEQWNAPPRRPWRAGPHGVLAGGRSLAADVAERLAALA